MNSSKDSIAKRLKLSQEESDSDCDETHTPQEPVQKPRHSLRENRGKRSSDEAKSLSKRVKSIILASSSERGGECGIIERVCMTNFMCHKKLEVTLGQNVNLILGRNGSGKSAIMSAIYVGLGGRAMSTNRGSSIKTFIQKGQTYAQVEVTLRNVGDDAYHPEKFGQRIHVVRRISSDGSSTYKIRNNNNKTEATTKDELNNILEQFSIQIENPISMLNQDTSRSFLASNNPGNMYKLFMKATHLEQMCQDYEHIDQALSKLKYVIATKSILTKEMEQEIKNLENIYKGMERIISLQANLTQKYREQAWVLVKEKENLMIPIEHKIKKCERALEKFDKEIDSSSLKMNQFIESFTKTKEKYEAKGSQAKDLHTERSNANSLIAKAKQVKMELELELRGLEKSISSCKKECNFFENKIRELKESAKRDLTPLWEERRKEEEKLAEEKHEVERKLAKIEQEAEENQNLFSNMKNKMENLRNKVSNNESSISDTKSRIKRLQQSQSNKVSLYGDYMASLMDIIRANSRSFSSVPKGPIGSYLSVVDKKWALGVEACIGGLLKTFLVHNMNDRLLLHRYMKEASRDYRTNLPPIVVTQFTGKSYDVQRFRAKCTYPTVLDQITSRDVDVMNYLIDTAQIESIILIEDHKMARDIMWKNTLTNCNTAYTIAGDEIQKRGSAFSNRNKQVKYLEEDVSKSINSYETNLRSHQQEKYQNTQSLDACKSEIKLLETAQGKQRGEGKQLGALRKNLERNIEDLIAKTSEEQKQQEEIEPFENALQESQLKEQQHQSQAGEKAQLLQTAKQELDREKQVKREVEDKCEQLKEQMEAVKRELTELKEQRDEEEGKVQYYQEKREKVVTIIRTETEKCDHCRNDAEQLASEALRNCGERTDSNSTSKSLQSEIKETKKAISQQQKAQKMSREECTQKLTKRLEEYKLHRDTMKVMSRLHNKLGVALQIRMKKHKELQDMMIIRGNHYFQQYLSKRNYSGRIRFDPSTETLTLEVTTNKLNRQGTQNTCTLSGGERSYTTVCFIMSLWEAMESPFRCLDEFDVFMDMVNRTICIDLMMSTAAEFRDRQFIFFTPLDMTSYVSSNVDVKILQLSQPERSNST